MSHSGIPSHSWISYRDLPMWLPSHAYQQISNVNRLGVIEVQSLQYVWYCCGPRPGEAALAPPSQVWVRFNSNEPATLNTLIQYMWWPWVCRERNARSPVNKNARTTVDGTVLCRLDVLDMYLIKHLTREFLQILIIRDVMNFWNFEVWDFSEMPILNLRQWLMFENSRYLRLCDDID